MALNVFRKLSNWYVYDPETRNVLAVCRWKKEALAKQKKVKASIRPRTVVVNMTGFYFKRKAV